MNKISTLNTSGKIGIYYSTKYNRIQAYFNYNKKRYTKTFSTKRYSNAQQLAFNWIEEMKLKVIPEGHRVQRDLIPKSK